MKETLCKHTCDQCGKEHIETKTSNWIQGWYSISTTVSYFYGSNLESKEFCSLDCVMKWANNNNYDAEKI